MIQMTVTPAPLMTMEKNNEASAASKVIIRRPNCVVRACLTLSLVLGFIGVHVDLSKLTHWDTSVIYSTQLAVHRILHFRTESGCRFMSTNGPLGWGLGCTRVWLASVAALGLKGRSVGPWKLYVDGRS